MSRLTLFLTRIFLPALVIGGVSALYFTTAPLVPFHPDESTYLYTSQDLHAWLDGEPANLSYTPATAETRRVYYRLVDPPFAKLMIGLGLALGNANPPLTDWRWNIDWESNLAAGSLPDSGALLAGRLAVQVWFPLTLLWVYWIGHKFGGVPTGFLAVLFFGLNALTLLHTRRAMSEGILIFFSALTLTLMLHKPRQFIFAAAAAALAMNTKVTGAASAGLALFATCFPVIRISIRQRAIRLIATGAVILAVTTLLNPVHWNDPRQSLPAAFKARSVLMSDQKASLNAANPEKVLTTLLKRAASLAGNQFFQPPALSDISNYDAELGASFEGYRALPIHRFSQGNLIGTLRLLTATLGIVLFFRALLRSRNYPHLLFLTGWLLTLLAGLFGSTLPFQRYALPLILYEAVFSATALVWFVKPFLSNKKPER